jgi:hypothetical protein
MAKSNPYRRDTSSGQSDLAINPGAIKPGNSNYGGPLHNWDGTLVTPEESNNGGYYAQLEQHAKADQGSWSEFLTGAGRVVAGVGLMGALVAAPEIGGAIGGLGGAATAGAISGAAGTTLGDKIGNKPVTLGGVGKGAAMGAVGGALGYAAAPATNALTDAGLPTPLASGIVKGGISAGTNALGSAMSGGNIANSAISGGVGGFLNGAVGNATGSGTLGKIASGVGGMALSPLLSGSNASGNQAGNIMASVNPQTYGMSGGSALAPQSTDTTLAGTITGALPGLLQGAAGVYGSQNAAQALTNADTNAINTQQSTLGNINNIWATQQQTGQGANTALQSSLGLNGQKADPSNFLNMPGYQFAVQQGTQAIQRQAAAMGNAYTPNTAEAVGQYVTGTAAQDYNTYINQLMGAAGLGSTANTGIANPTYQTGANISTLQQNQGYAQASGVSGSANAVGGIFGVNGAGTSLIGAAGRALGGGSAPGGSAPGGVGTSAPYQGGGYTYGAPAGGDVNGGVNSSGIPNYISPQGAPTSSGVFDPNNTSFSAPPLDTSGGAFDPNNISFGSDVTDWGS